MVQPLFAIVFLKVCNLYNGNVLVSFLSSPHSQIERLARLWLRCYFNTLQVAKFYFAPERKFYAKFCKSNCCPNIKIGTSYDLRKVRYEC